MSKTNLAIRNKINFILFLFFVVSSITYFLFRTSHVWVRSIFPDAMALVFLSFLLNMMIHRNTKLITYMLVFGSIFVVFVGLFILGTLNNYLFITDISQEFISVSFITLIVALILRKKIVV